MSIFIGVKSGTPFDSQELVNLLTELINKDCAKHRLGVRHRVLWTTKCDRLLVLVGAGDFRPGVGRHSSRDHVA